MDRIRGEDSTKIMYEYQLGLALVKELDENQKGLDERADFIKSQILIYNEKSLRSIFNPKHILVLARKFLGVI